MAVLAAPRLVDWNRFKPEVTARLHDLLGREVSIEGDIAVELLPRLSFTAQRLSLAAAEGFPQAARLEAARLFLDLPALLRGHLLVERILLERPQITIATAGSNLPQLSLIDSGGGALPFDELLIQDGTVVIRNAAGDEHRIDGVEARLRSGGRNGPFQLAARSRWGGGASLEASLGRIGDQGATLSAILRLEQPSAELRFGGRLAQTPGGSTVAGKLAVTAVDLAAVVAVVTGDATPLLAQPFVAEATLATEGGVIALDDLTARLGETAASGAAELATRQGRPRLGLVLSFASINADRLATRLTEFAAGPFSLPAAFDLELEASAEAVIWRGGALRRARIDAALENGRLQLRQAAALLPGGSDLLIYGSAAGAAEHLAYDGGFELSADNLRATLAWLGCDPATVPPDRLRRLSATGRVAGDGHELRLSEVAAQLDTTRLSGAVHARLGERPALGVTVLADSFNLDAYLPAERPDDGRGAVAVLEEWAAIPELARLDANVRLKAGQLLFRGEAVRDVEINGTLQGGRLQLRQAGFRDGGMRLALSGAVTGLGGQVAAPETLTLRLAGEPPARLMRLLGLDPPAGAETIGAVSLDAAFERGRVRAQGRFGAGSLTIAGRLGADGADLTVEASHPRLVDLIRAVRPDYRPPAVIGGAAFAGRLRGDRTRLRVEDMRATIDTAAITGSAEISWSGRPRLRADLAADELPLGLLWPAARQTEGESREWSRAPLDLAWLAAAEGEILLRTGNLRFRDLHLRQATLRLVLADNAAFVQNLSGQLFGGGFALAGRAGADGALSATFTLADASLEDALAAATGKRGLTGTLSVAGNLGSRGDSISALVGGLGGSARILARDGLLHRFDLRTIAEAVRGDGRGTPLRDLLATGFDKTGTRFSDFSGTLRAHRGLIRSDDLALVTEDGVLGAVGLVDLPAYAIRSRLGFALKDRPRASAVLVDVVGPLDQPRQTFDPRRLQAYLVSGGSAAAAAGEGNIAGLLERLLQDQGSSPSLPYDAQTAESARPAR